MRIALLQFYSPTPTPVYDQLAAILRSWGHHVTVGTPDEAGDLVWNDGSGEVLRTRGPGRRKTGALAPFIRRATYLLFMMRVRRDIHAYAPDIAQINKTTYCGILPWRKPPGIRFVFDVRQLGLWGEETSAGRRANRRVIRRVRRNSLRRFDIACFPSVEAAALVLGEQWKSHAIIAPIGVSPLFLEYRHPGPSAAVSRPMRFIYVGSLARAKRLDGLIEAIAFARERGGEFFVTLMGPGDGRSYYLERTRSLGLEGTVRVHPAVSYEEVPRLVAEHDVSLAYIPPVEDWKYQVTLKVLEYRALGVPILASDLPPNRGVVRSGENGLLAGNEPQVFGSAMLRFASDPAFLATCKTGARAMREGRTWRDVAAVYMRDAYGGGS